MRRALVTNAWLAGALVAGMASGTWAADLDNGSFERSGPAWGRSLDAEWGGDPVAFVGPTQGITPFDGRRMVQFLATSNGEDLGNVASDVWQVIDLRAERELVRTGQAIVSAVGWVNRVAGGPTTDTLFAMDIQAFSGDASLYLAAPQDHLAKVVDSVRSDADPETWQPVATSLCLPLDTEFVVVRFHANENVRNDRDGVEFDGHFGDGVTVSFDLSDDCNCPADVNADGMTDVEDFLNVVRRLGRARGVADVNSSGLVGFDDVLEVVHAMDGCR